MRPVASRRSDASHARRIQDAETSDLVVRRVPSSNATPNFVAMTTESQLAPRARARTFPLCPVSVAVGGVEEGDFELQPATDGADRRAWGITGAIGARLASD